jgi:hypothetical protein
MHPVDDKALAEKSGLGLSTRKIAAEYNVSAATVQRHLRRFGIPLRDPAEALINASTKYEKSPFSGDMAEAAYLGGFIEDCHVRRSGRQIEVSTTTTHPSMEMLFRRLFQNYGNVHRIASFDHLHFFYRFQFATLLESSFESLLKKGPGSRQTFRK